MDQEILVDDRVEDGEKLLAQLVRAGFDVSVAFWVLTADEQTWLLYIGLNGIAPGRVPESANQLYLALTRVPDASLSFSDVRLVHSSDPLARAALALRERRPGRMPIRYRGKQLGNLAIEEAYIYPKMGPMTRDEVRQTFMAHLDPNGSGQPATFTLADGSSRRAIPIGVHLFLAGARRGLQFELQDPATSQRQDIAADDVIDIR